MPSQELSSYSSAGRGGEETADAEPDRPVPVTLHSSDAGNALGSRPVAGEDHDAAAPASDGGNSGSSADGGDGTDTAVDTAPPTILSVSPVDGALGVAGQTPIVVTFSESMDTELAQAAFECEGVDPDQARFEWSNSDRVLTIVPGGAWQYATGEDAATVQPRTYAYGFSGIARDLAGNGLTPATFSFSTLREIATTLTASADSSQTGNWASQGIYGQGSCAEDSDLLCVGDGGLLADAQYRGFASFALDDLDEEAEISAARLQLAVAGSAGNAFEQLGELRVEQVTFAAIGDLAFDGPSTATLASWTELSGSTLTADVSAALRAQIANAALAQYRFTFALPSNLDGVADMVVLQRSGIELLVHQLLP